MAQESASSATTASEIAFTSDRTGSPAIYVMEADGSNPVNVSHAVGSGVYPAWSPDGTKIAFMAFMNVWVMDADGNNPVQITSYLLFTTIAQQPLWMPAGTIGYLLWSESIPERWSIVGSPVRFPRDWLGSGYLDIGGLSWSPDGKKLAFHSTRDGNYEIYTMGADGNTPLKLTDHPGTDRFPTWSPDGMKIAFVSNRDGQGEGIYAMGVDGSNPLKLAITTAQEEFSTAKYAAPTWSPDGTRIAFGSNSSGNWEICAMNADGTAPVNLTRHPANDWSPAWSPPPQEQLPAETTPPAITGSSPRNGAKGIEPSVVDKNGIIIAFSEPVDTASVQIRFQTGELILAWHRLWSASRDTLYLLPGAGHELDFGTTYRLTLSQVRDRAGNTAGNMVLTFSTRPAPAETAGATPASPKITFVSDRDGNFEIYAMNVDGGDPVNLTSHPARDSNPAWSPDGTKITFTSDRDGGGSEIYSMNADGTNPVRLTNHSAFDFGFDPAWSPDGMKIAFVSNRKGNHEIYVMNADGSNLVNLTHHALPDYNPAWSPDGARIAFERETHLIIGPPSIQIFAMKADGTDQVELTDSYFNGGPIWSPDGAKIAFHSGSSSGSTFYTEIHVMSADGSNLVNLTNHPARDSDPAWSPEGRKIAFTSDRDGNFEIYVMSADGSNLANLTNHPARDSNPAWSPVIADTGNVATPLLGIVEVVPPVFTPNGDKVNDEISVRIRAEGVQRSWVKVYDLAGHCVRDLPMESMPPSGERRGGWDGRSDAGSLLPPGVYLICIHFVNARNQDKEIMRLVVRQLNSFTLDAALSLSAEGSEVKKLN